MNYSRSARAVALLAAAAALPAASDSRISNLTKAVVEFRLANGVQFFVVERPQSPIVAFHLRVKAGLADEPAGQSGVAQLALTSFLEGTELYGSSNPAKEKATLAEAETLLAGYRAEDAKGEQIDDLKKGRFDSQARSALGQAVAFAHGFRHFQGVLSNNGATGFEARASADYSDLAVTLPSHLSELWFRMAGGWLQTPSSRFYYQGRAEYAERRAQSAKTGAAMRELAFASVFVGHPYRALAGDGDLNLIWAAEMRAFLKSHYVPANLTVAIVGDIAAVEARRLADLYFGKLPAAAAPPPKLAIELKAEGAHTASVAAPEAAVLALAWPRPLGDHADDAAFDILQAVTTGGPGSRFHSELMGGAPVASRLRVNARFPGGRFAGLFLIEAEPTPSTSMEELEGHIGAALLAMTKDAVTEAELERARMWWRSRWLSEARPAAGRALQLARAHTEYGSYKIEDRLARIERITAADCRRLVTEYLAAKAYWAVQQLTSEGGGQ